jgi:hypothetical protein
MNLNSKVADLDEVFGGRPHTVNTEFLPKLLLARISHDGIKESG